MSNNISVSTCKDVEFNKMKIEDFNAVDYFPEDYEIRQYGVKTSNKKQSELIEKKAPDWVLNDVSNKIVSLKEIKSKVVLIQFTSVNCGPCRASIPFLRELESEYNKEEFDLVAIASFNRNSNVLKNYQRGNNFDYKFLASTDEVTNGYKIRAVPVFFIIDENRVIKKVINGYGKGSTDKEIRKAINDLL